MKRFTIGQNVKDADFNHPGKIVEITDKHVFVSEFFLVRYTIKEAQKYLSIF